MRTILYIIAEILLGIFAGIFFGERTQYIAFVGQVFIMLLQMAVLPYLITSITHSIFCLSGF